jgi:subtilisin family serine protease
MKRFLLVLLIALSSSWGFAQMQVIRGERPVIDLESVPVDAYEVGKIQIKLIPSMDKSIPDVLISAEKNGFIVTGIKSLDNLNQIYGAKQYKPLLHNFYESSPKSSQYRERHKAWGFHLWFEIDVDSKSDVKEMVKKFSALAEVEIAEPVFRKRLISNVNPNESRDEREQNTAKDSKWTPSDTRYNEQWHYHNTGQQGGTIDKDIDLPEAWDIEKGLSTIIVAVIDGGIQTNHPDLAGNIWTNKGYNFVTNSSTLQPHDHGTHVAGTVAAVNNNGTGVSGVAGGSGANDGVRLMSCQVFNSSSSGGFDQAPIYAADNGAAISQNSWGYTSVNVYDQATLDAIDYFNANGGGGVLNGGITIFAAGNDNKTGNWYPGCYSGAFAVAATNNKDVRSYYSNYGDWVDISAPGGEQSSSTDPKGVLSTLTNSSYGFYQGTSMACPHVSGVAALLVSNAVRNGITLTNTQLADLLKNNVDDHYSLNSGYIGKLGSGRLNAHKALVALQSLFTNDPPTTPTGLSTINVTDNSATLSWNAASGASSYDVQLRQQGGTWTTQTVTGTSVNATGLSAETTYEWQVRAKNANGTSSYSSIQLFTTLAYVVTYCESKGSNSSYEWIAKVDVGSFSNSSGAAGYTDFTSKVISLQAGQSYSVSLTPGFASTTYNEYWKIWIDLNGDGTFDTNELVFDPGSMSKTTVTGSITIPSGAASITTRMRVSMKYNAAQTACETFSYGEVEDYTVQISAGATPPATPTGLAASNVTATSFSLSWNASSGATSYDVQIRPQGGTWNTYNVTSTSYNAAGLNSSTTYEAQVRAKNSAGNSSYCSAISVTTLTAIPSVPTGLNSSNITTNSATLSWNASSGATSYDVQIRPQGGTWSTYNVTSTSYNATGLNSSTTYEAQVRAKNSAGSSNYSSAISLTTLDAVPSVPTGLSSTSITTNSATLSWSASSGATSYDVQLRPQGGSWNTYNVTTNSYNASNLASNTIYEWQVRAKNSTGASNYSTLASFTTQQEVVTYCTSMGNNSSYEWIAKVDVGSFSSSSGAAGYTDFTSKVITLEAGKSYSISLTPGFASTTYNEYWKIWVDLNGNATFDSNDLLFDAGSLSKTTVTGTITIPVGTAPITTRMRVSMKYNAAQTACESFSYGEVEDYTVVIVAAQTNPPATPTGLSSTNITTSGATLSWNSVSDATSYDVQFRPQGGNWSTYNTTSNNYNASGLTASTTYEWQVRAKNAYGNSSYSTVSTFTTQNVTLTYCASKGNNANYEWIQRVQFAEIDNTSGKNGGYANFTAQTATVALGETLPIYFQAGFSGSSYTEYWSIWIDFNQNGTFDTDERIAYGSSSSSNLLTSNVTIPTNAVLGNTRMRVSMKYNAAQTACETFSYGEVEDYTVNVVQTKTSGFSTEPIAESLGIESAEIYTVYPNPAKDRITVSLNGIIGEVSLKIYDLQGRMVKDVYLYNLDSEIDVSDLAKGVYIISVDEEKMPINKRFVKM